MQSSNNQLNIQPPEGGPIIQAALDMGNGAVSDIRVTAYALARLAEDGDRTTPVEDREILSHMADRIREYADIIEATLDALEDSHSSSSGRC